MKRRSTACLILLTCLASPAQAVTFAELERALLDNNAQLQAAERQVEAARLAADAVASERWSPDVRAGLSAEQSRTDTPLRSSDAVSIDRSALNAGVTSSLNIFDSGIANLNTRLAANALEQARVAYTQQFLSLYVELTIGYARLGVLDDALTENSALLTRQQTLEARLKRQLGAGTIDKGQLQNLQETTLDLEATIVGLVRQREQAAEQLWNLTQITVDETANALATVPAERLDVLGEQTALSRDSLLTSQLWQDNPSVQLAELDLAEGRLRYEITRAAFGPSVSGNFQAGLAETLSPDGEYRVPESGSVSATLNVSIPLFDNGVRRARRSAAASRQSAAMDQVVQAKRDFVNDINRNLYSLRAAEQRRDLFRKRLFIATQLVAESEALVVSGSRTLFDFAQSLQREVDARSLLVQAELDLVEAQVNLLALLGIYR